LQERVWKRSGFSSGGVGAPDSTTSAPAGKSARRPFFLQQFADLGRLWGTGTRERQGSPWNDRPERNQIEGGNGCKNSAQSWVRRCRSDCRRQSARTNGNSRNRCLNLSRSCASRMPDFLLNSSDSFNVLPQSCRVRERRAQCDGRRSLHTLARFGRRRVAPPL
jgi:hypothetical protein